MFPNQNPSRSGFTRSREGREVGQVFDLSGGSKTRPAGRTFALGLLLTLALVPLSRLHAGDTAPVSAERKASLDILDGVLARFAALLAKDDDAAHKAATQAKLDEFKARRDALRQDFDQGRYDELRVDLNLEYQRLASWMAPPKTPPPRAAAQRATSNIERSGFGIGVEAFLADRLDPVTIRASARNAPTSQSLRSPVSILDVQR